MYYLSISFILLQYWCFTYYWEVCKGDRKVAILATSGALDDRCSCQIDVTDKSFNSVSHPLFLEPESNQVIYPEPNTTTVIIPTGEGVLLHCPGVTNMILNDDHGENTYQAGPVLLAKCVYGQIWRFEQLNNFETSFRSVECKGRIKTWARLGTYVCEGNSRYIETGFRLESGRYVTILSICFNYVMKHPLYVRTYISRGITDIQRLSEIAFDDSLRKSFSAEFYRLYTPFNELYSRNNIRLSINKQLGLDKNSIRYVGLTDAFNIYNTLLISHINFLYPFEKRATYYYINTVPMWKKNFTSGWEKMEIMFRKYTVQTHRDLDIYAGTHSTLQLPHNETKECVQVYLHHAIQAGLIPIPGVLWRVAVDMKKKAGIAIVVHNNPFNVCVEPHLCLDISENLTWVQQLQDMMKPMKVYACSVQNFLSVVPFKVPVLLVRKTLQLTPLDIS